VQSVVERCWQKLDHGGFVKDRAGAACPVRSAACAEENMSSDYPQITQMSQIEHGL